MATKVLKIKDKFFVYLTPEEFAKEKAMIMAVSRTAHEHLDDTEEDASLIMARCGLRLDAASL